MSAKSDPRARAALDSTIETIESSYEFMLAYAAQGRDQEGTSPSIRATLTVFADALGALGGRVEALIQSGHLGKAALEGFLVVLQADAAAARTCLSLALATPSITSQLVDNLNASIHLRALLTDVFLIDEALKSFARAK